jgi:mannose-6-phosphate isomerase-like protein (cupin superfamily)/ligand-binding sensor protein
LGKANVQYFDWGHIEWKYEPEEGNSLSIMHIGIITIFPGKRQTKHVHYGDEQFIYVLSGKGEQLIDDASNSIEPGASYHIEAGAAHETINTGQEPIVELLISIPANYETGMMLQQKEEKLLHGSKKAEASITINESNKGVYEGFINSLKIPLSIFDNRNNVILEGHGFPDYCESKCNIKADLLNCCIYGIKDSYTAPQFSDPSAFICPYGLTVFNSPIAVNNEVIGMLKGGHFRISSDAPASDDINIIPKARMKAISLQIKKLIKNIVSYYIFENTEVELEKKEESLKSSQEKVLNLQINNHFLFNTLNAIAGLAVRENAFKTYESVISLSKMFRYSLKAGSSLITLGNELDYLLEYTNLQKLRYGSRLEVKTDIAEEIKELAIPCNCLQPILENCFIHGFKDKKGKLLIEVLGKKDSRGITIEIRDNGRGMSEKEIEALYGKLHHENEAGRVSGLKMIYSRLLLFYSQGFDFTITGAPGKGTSISISISV